MSFLNQGNTDCGSSHSPENHPPSEWYASNVETD
ncbi:hypothetical protein TorRG33x02_213320 [Trema orientale]|uniref:Uncharacterized protein n=1 Tax=Trema orientale TaxID=63057 RepID=A0A2P5EBI9_TREOI|nr:hypothetical protein TorRG33x02_213320 [Trema orientale]